MGKRSSKNPHTLSIAYQQRFYPRKPAVYPPIPPLPTDADFGLIDRFFAARRAGDLDEMKACILLAKQLIEPPPSSIRGPNCYDWNGIACLLGIPTQAKTTLARIRHAVGMR